MTTAATLAGFLTKTNFKDLPPLAIERAQMVVASTIASAAMGSNIGSANAFRAVARERGGTPEATIWFDSEPKLPVVEAARTNAVMSDAAASDDSDLRRIAHIGTIISSTAIAMGERTGANGQDVLAAMVLGYEISGRLCDAVAPQDSNFHTGVITIFAAAVAAGKLLHLTEEQLTHAISLAATSIGGLGNVGATSWAREYDAGLSAMLGTTAAMAAQKGFTAETSVMEMPRGYFEVFKGKDIESVTRDLGKEWDITTNMAIKLVPGGHPSHAVIEAVGNAAREANVPPDEIEAIILSYPPYVAREVDPKDLLAGAHSISYSVACAIVDGAYGWDALANGFNARPERIADKVIASLRAKVQAGDPPANAAQLLKTRGGVASIKTKAGKTFTSVVGAPRGSAPRGIDWADVDAKYRRLVPLAGLASKNVEDSLKVIHAFDRAKSITELTSLLKK